MECNLELLLDIARRRTAEDRDKKTYASDAEVDCMIRNGASILRMYRQIGSGTIVTELLYQGLHFINATCGEASSIGKGA